MTPRTVTELNAAISQSVQHLTPEALWVTGTLTTWKRSRAWTRGELTVYTGTTPAAKLQLGCRTKTAIGIDKGFHNHHKKLTVGTDVAVLGQLSFHPVYGLRLNVTTISADTAAQSTTAKTRLDLINKLHHSGLATKQQQLTPPTTIQTIGLVTPLTGDAARQDALTILQPFGLILDERRVHTAGPAAANAIRAAIGQLETTSDLILCIRGGGPSADLTVWNDERVVTAIANAQRPIIVGVGHATDHLLATDVAHHGATTPTAAAQWIAEHLTPAPAALEAPAQEPVIIYRDRPVDRRITIALVVAAIVIALLVIALITQTL